MSQFYPPVVTVLVVCSGIIGLEVIDAAPGYSLALPGWVAGVTILAIGLAWGIMYMYSPLPNSNGGMGISKDGGYWGWSDDE